MLPDVLLVVGAALVSVGFGLLHPSAGCISAGVFLILAGRRL